MFNFTPLLGAQSESRASQSLLELDGGVKILVDVGWDEAFEAETLQALEQHVSSLSLVLLTHPTIDHLGAYAHCCKHIPLFNKVPVYATTPVINLGRTLLTDLYASSPLAASVIPTSTISSPQTASASDASPNLLLEAPNADEIGSYFTRINSLKYSQPHQPTPATWSPSLSGLMITAYSAGHTLGGTIWHIQQGTESIVYAADFNQGRENLLPSTSLLAGGSEIIEPLRQPTALVCSSKGVERTHVKRAIKDRDETLIHLIRETIAQGGKVLLPTDTSARVLELAFVLNKTWSENIDGPHADTYKQTRIYMAAKSASTTIRYLQSMVEWVNDAVRGETEAAITNRVVAKGQEAQVSPLEWQHIKLLEKQSQLDRALRRKGPCVMLASDASLEWGLSRQALQKLASDPRNLVVMTEDASHGASKTSVARQLWEAWDTRQSQASDQNGAKIVDSDGITVELREAGTAPLDENETALYETYTARQRQLHSTLQGDNTEADPSATLEQEEEESEDEEDDADEQQQGRALNVTAQLTQSNKRKVALSDAELGVNVLLRGKTVFDYDVRHSNRGRDKVYPFATHKHREDEFGEVIKADDYVRAEERDDVDGIDMRNGDGKQEASVGQKRKWDDAGMGKGKHGRGDRRGSKAQNKRQKQDPSKPREPDDIDAAIARATGQNAADGDANGTANSSGSDSDEESDYDPSDALPQPPQKVIFTTHHLPLNLKLAHVDFSGLHEKRDLSMIIPLMRPRKLVLISGSVSETTTLRQACEEAFAKQNNTTPTIFTPVTGETVDASVDTNAWTLKLSRQLAKRIKQQTKEIRPGIEVVAVSGLLTNLFPPSSEEEEEEVDDQATKKPKLSSPPVPTSSPTTNPPTLPILDILSLLPSTTTTTSLSTYPVHVGDLRLAFLRDYLLSRGHSAAFRGEGTLLVDSSVLVRKSGSGGKVEIETAGTKGAGRRGTVVGVRRAVYGGLAVVGGV